MTALSWIGSLWLALSNIVGPFYGWLSVKVGYKWMLVTALILCTLSMMLSSIATQIWHLYLTQGVLSGIGASLIWFTCISASQQWFSRRRGLSVGIAISGSGFGGLVLSNVVQAAIDKLGYQWALRIIGFISFVCLSVTVCTVRPLNPLPKQTPLTVFDLRPLRNTQFVLLFFVNFIGNFAFNVPSTFLKSYTTYLHLDPWIGTNMSAIISGVMIVGKITSGMFGDYLGRANVTSFVTIMTGVVSLAVWLPAKNAATVWAFAALFGYFGGGHLSTVPGLLGQVVGMEDIEAANGLLYFSWFFGGLLGSPICSALINENNGEPNYPRAIIFGGVLMIFAGLLALTVRIMRGGWNPFVKV
ncbi:major facilitator superfamily domain-containing protein [Sporodiniella umbellata]|nr:major facilitator superfamily domain-containing protein [Sporodiniella umbellata]